jgi:ribosomal protein L11 methyltransferase
LTSLGTWQAVRVWPDPAARDAVMAVLFDYGSEGVHEDGVSIVTCFPDRHDMTALQAAITRLAPETRIEITPVPNIDWVEHWKDQARVHCVGQLTIAPPWLASGSAIVIEPAMAFGTGEHATTRGVLHLMQSVIRPGDLVADLGAGSAILSIAAATLGAARVAAIELDADAISNAESNVRRNGVAHRVHVIHGDALILLPLLAPVRVVLANIISSTLIDLLPVMDAATTRDGVLILSGVLRAERAHVMSAIGAAAWSVLDDIAEDEWWSVSLGRIL